MSFEVITELCYKVSPPGHIPSHIKQPPYAKTGVPPVVPRSIEIKTDEQIAAMKTACRTARKVLNVARDNIKVRLEFTTVNSSPGGEFLHRKDGAPILDLMRIEKAILVPLQPQQVHMMGASWQNL